MHRPLLVALVASCAAVNAQEHWAYVPPVRPVPPATGGSNHPVDAFVHDRLARAGLLPSNAAPREVLIRRVTLDLVGLLPAPAEVARFVADTSPDAYERLVERLLASPHFGERWGRHWLDGARYADSHGYSIDGARSIWPYRDWVVAAINDDMPFDRFVTEQIAGDLLPDATPEQKIATGFHRNTMINQEGGVDREEFRIEAVKDRVNTTSTVFLGLTFACSQCHDHKYDALPQREYYELYAFFNDDDERNLDFVVPEDRADHPALKRELERRKKALALRETELRNELAANPLIADGRVDLPKKVLRAVEKPPERRSKGDKSEIEKFVFANDADWKERKRAFDEQTARMPRVFRTMILARRKEARTSHVHVRGAFHDKGAVVQPGVPDVLPPLQSDGRGTRLDLARWLVDPGHPLTARVVVNRMWQRLFGIGLVATENDFGTQGERPSHPRLLDWLATELVRNGWSRKALVRTIVTSATYRQVSIARDDAAQEDPRNTLLARQNRVRLDAEIIRDASLSAADLLSAKVGGPSVFPPQPDGVMKLGQSNRRWRASPGDDSYRRGIYTFFWRATPHPALSVFDAPSALEACTRRNRSNTPLQALTLLNEAQFVECARALGERIERECEGHDAARIDYAFRVCLSRRPAPGEVRLLEDLLRGELESGSDRPFVALARVLLNLDEFITRE